MLGEPDEHEHEDAVVLLGFEDDGLFAHELAGVLDGFNVWLRLQARRFDADALIRLVRSTSVVLVCVAHPERAGSDLARLVDAVVGVRGQAGVLLASPTGTYSGTLMTFAKQGLPLVDLGRKLDPHSEAIRKLRIRVASELVSARPLDLPASLFRSAVEQRSIELLAESLSLAATWPLGDWDLAQPGDGGRQPNPLWSSWLEQTRGAELKRLSAHLDELRVQALLERGAAESSASMVGPTKGLPSSLPTSKRPRTRGDKE